MINYNKIFLLTSLQVYCNKPQNRSDSNALYDNENKLKGNITLAGRFVPVNMEAA